MTDDPYPSLKPVVNAIAGFFIACSMLSVPFLATSRVKSPYEGIPPKENGNTTQAAPKRNLPFMDAGDHFRISSSYICRWNDKVCYL